MSGYVFLLRFLASLMPVLAAAQIWYGDNTGATLTLIQCCALLLWSFVIKEVE